MGDFEPVFSRRGAMAASVLAGAGLALPASSASAQVTHPRGGGDTPCTTPHSAIARTRFGPVRGYISGDVLTFKGVPYGADTGGANRWLPAKEPSPWTEPLSTLSYGPNCPQSMHDMRNSEHTFIQQWTDGFVGEDMLKLNIWTPSLSGNRPVMVYFHGGGFSFGSSYELASHDGAQMARNHDVVQVSINHRLNVLGFLDLRHVGGAAYEDSVNCSMMDCIAALRWVRENIANFGGDPDKVMIYGQSGGGSKVTTMLGMPAGRGLIHRASIQSGGGGNQPPLEMSQEFSRRVLASLNISRIEDLQRASWQTLFDAGNRVALEMNGPQVVRLGFMNGPPRVGWWPTVDGKNITMASFHDGAPEISKDIPILVGSVTEEGTALRSNPTEAQWRETLAGQFGAPKADALMAAMKAANPNKSIRTLSYAVGGYGQRNAVQNMVRMKYEQQAAPVYQWWFTWQSPVLDGQAGAWHTAELAFCFDNAKLCEQGTGNTPEAQALARKMSTAWANFARTGNPSQPGLEWTPTDPVNVQTMVFDDTCGMVNDPHAEVRRVLLG